MSTGVILLAAGQGRRFGKGKAKQLLRLGHELLFLKSFRTFHSISSIKEVILVVPPKKQNLYRRLCGVRGKKIKIVAGGAYRGKSVKNGYMSLSEKCDVILIHDTARPLVDKEIIKRVEKAAKQYGAALAAWPLTDSLKYVGPNSRVKKSIPRKNLWLAQTPQGFSRRVADKSLLYPNPKATDDVELAHKKGYRAKIVVGAPQNIKVTYPFDLKLCTALTRARK